MAIGDLHPGKLPVGLLVELLATLGPQPPEVTVYHGDTHHFDEFWS
ncbi:MAG TPA: hypothetical protein VFW06_10170 [Acidimicrobiia bacterium]|nr:hypothetical protein [Acidimicrobiia bacterium]